MISYAKLFVAQAGISREEWCGFHVTMGDQFQVQISTGTNYQTNPQHKGQVLSENITLDHFFTMIWQNTAKGL